MNDPDTVALTFYGQLRDVFGVRTRRIAAPPTVDALLTHLARDTPAFAALRGSTAVAVDDVLVALDAPLHAGAEVALLPPVSGG